ncbi:hypothetical protein NPIL_403531 [Nephila pilipes]|uniref:Uncharacterized protein n=1 Tax=Nephila pilipes TaxID=299642 RepID=A0A8X6NPF0_NEPPI|nr:hypothetical protein NPIL_403531 [Nephila pilipes]
MLTSPASQWPMAASNHSRPMLHAYCIKPMTAIITIHGLNICDYYYVLTASQPARPMASQPVFYVMVLKAGQLANDIGQPHQPCVAAAAWRLA